LEQKPGEAWADYVDLSAVEVLGGFRLHDANTDFRTEAIKGWEIIRENNSRESIDPIDNV
jgi:hypothetical protein